ncbi:hypothetical protein [Trueperella sp. LYQ143]|uniref:hypothetical protein n=1 Tax=Trueperella sp. LYQ143 TaxID=3391059 RepID=UPI003983ACEE
MSTVYVTARPWHGGWELELNEDNCTQVTNLDHARQQVIDYLDSIDPATDHSQWTIKISHHTT